MRQAVFTTSSISIHAPAWGATPCPISNILNLAIFQFTLPRGERLLSLVITSQRKDISIHAPAWGATRVLGNVCHPHIYFNSRSRVGSDVFGSIRASTYNISIHAPAWGATAKTTNLSLYLSFLFIQMRQIFSTSHFCLLRFISKTPLFQVRTSWRFHVCYTFALQAIFLIFLSRLRIHLHTKALYIPCSSHYLRSYKHINY